MATQNTTSAFKITKAENYMANMAFVKTISSEKGQKEHRTFYNRFKAMVKGFEKWTQMTERKYNNLNQLREEFYAPKTGLVTA